MLKLIDIHKTFNPGTINEKVALSGVDLHLNEGDFVTVIGGNGAGKSTMLNAVAGTWPVDEGQILIDNIDVTKLSEHKRATYLGRVFQDPMNGTAATMGIEENGRWSAAKEESTKRKERNGLNCLISGKIIPGMVMQENIMRVRPGALNRRCRTVISKALTD